MRGITASRRKTAKELIERLEALGVDDAEAIAKAEIVDLEPAVARLALERRIRDALLSKSPRTAVAAAIEAILTGKDDDLGTEWKLVDGNGRRIRAIDLEG